MNLVKAYLNWGSSVIYSFETEIRKKSFPEGSASSSSLRIIEMPSSNVYAMTATGGMNNSPVIRVITVKGIEKYNKIIILAKAAIFNLILLSIIMVYPDKLIPQGLYKIYDFRYCQVVDHLTEPDFKMLNLTL